MIVCEQDYRKSIQPISLQLAVMTGHTNSKNRFTFGGDPTRITCSLPRAELGILADLLAFLVTYNFLRNSAK